MDRHLQQVLEIMEPKSIDRIFWDAAQIPSASERDAYLDRACAEDVALRRRIEQLLQARPKAERFLESPAPPLVRRIQERSSSEGLGTIIGPYKLLEQIGEGGFGTVFMAEQQHPVRRKVALKVLKPGMDTRQVVARFEAERQALALMDHPHIAQVFDGGETVSGRPYFVMELVRGVPITEFCDENCLMLPERLELFVAVCQAVQHAHQKGIIHRDLKPSNVLVTLLDGTPLVKVIDFGIAKALGQERLTERTLCTGFAQMLGTPLYMSPEQAEMSGQDVDTRTDIYALGVLLYELLTGTTPFDKERLKEASYDEIRRIIREEEPAKPSTRISTLGQAATTVSANRQSAPKRLSQQFRGELDWIVMKPLEKDRNRRYESASAFAADVQRYLHDEPVQACPPSAVYRFRKFARRNKIALVTATAVALVVLLAVIGLATSTVLIGREQQATANALRAETQAKAHLEEALERERQNSYYQRIALAQSEWSANNLGRMDQLLVDCPADLRGWEWHYLKRLRLGGLPPLRHASQLFSAVFSPDGRWIASGSFRGMLTIWDATAGEERFSFPAHKNHVRCVAFSPNGRRLATASWDGTAKIWDFDPQRAGAAISLLHTCQHQAEVGHVAFSPDGEQLATEGDKTVQIWDVATGHEVLHALRGHTSLLSGIDYSPDGRHLALGSEDKTVRIWDAKTSQEKLALPAQSAPIQSMSFSHDGRWLALATGDGSSRADGDITIWDTRTGQHVRTLRGHTGWVYCAIFSPDGRRLASGGVDETVKLWDFETGGEVLTLHEHRGPVRSVDFSPDGTRLISASHDGTVRLWDATPLRNETGPEALTLSHGACVRCVAFSPNGRHLASAGDDASVKIWDIALGRAGVASSLPKNLSGGTGLKVKLAFNHDGSLLALGSDGGRDGGRLKVWETGRWQELTVKEFARSPTTGAPVTFSPDGQYLAAVGAKFSVEIRQATTGREIRRLLGHDWAIWEVAFSPNPEVAHLASASGDGTVRIWDVSTGQEIHKLSGHNFRCVAFSCDHRLIAAGGNDRIVRVWDAQTGQPLHKHPDSTGAVESLAFHPKWGEVLAWGSWDGTVKIWNIATDDIRIFRGHRSWVEGVAFSPDGEWLASASRDGTIKLWRVPVMARAPEQAAGVRDD
jgi:WD40 repeat protein/serine/threonine protein kinase